MNRDDKYIYQYNKLTESKSNLIDIANFMSNTIESKLKTLGHTESIILRVEKENEELKEHIELLNKSFIELLKLCREIERCTK